MCDITVNLSKDLILLHILFSCSFEILTSKDSFHRSVNNKHFIDKTLLLKEILAGNQFKLITAPRKCGKSTNVAMIKHFLQIEVNENGNPDQRLSGTNFKLFKDNNLKIFKDEKFFRNNFGKYPVISIDYSPLLLIENNDQFLTEYRKIISNTFLDHLYLLKNTSLWKNKSQKKLFEDFINKNTNLDQISQSFYWLSQLLHTHFNSKTFILFDDYDALVKGFIFRKNKDLIEISKICGETEHNILKCNNHSCGAVLTGELRLYRGEFFSYFTDWGNSKFSPFYGITELELDQLLQNTVKDKESLVKNKHIIDNFYGGYMFFGPCKKIKMYRTWPVINYLKTSAENASKICRPIYLEGFRKMCCVPQLKEWLQVLLSGKKVLHTHVDLHQPIFHRKHISILNSIITNKIIDKAQALPVLFLTLLYYFGYLTPSDEKLHWFQIPNKSVTDELESYTSDKSYTPRLPKWASETIRRT